MLCKMTSCLLENKLFLNVNEHNYFYGLQKRAVRNIEKTCYRTYTQPIFKSLNLIKVQDIYYLASIKVLLKTY